MTLTKVALVCSGFAAALAGCAGQAPVEPVSSPGEVRADVRDAAGRLIATAIATEGADGVRVRLETSALAPGGYGAHIHSVGRCDPPGFESAGPHWNPAQRQHGSQNPQGQHLGDLPNLIVGANGEGSFEFAIPGATLAGRRGMLDGDGAAIVVHAAADDYRTDPSGNSGARIACGVLG
ncbi:MAG TPA: superoxide dismutase family protein [Allosphingosinicella sp.]|jgi:Cu-Zn family superoxide dismutase|nr:superoxide dismutase family protein [Allosphingosinicella sp.]